MDQEKIIERTVDFVKSNIKNVDSGHDWWHIYRVWKLAKYIAEKEKGADLFIVELGALFHDIADYKFHGGDEEIAPRIAREFLTSMQIDNKIIEHVENIIRNVSYKGAIHVQKFKSKELDIVQDADRLDAMGAMGIARTFNYGGYKNRPIYDPTIKSNPNMTAEEYKKWDAPSINHFYEKLLLLKDKMNTKTGKKLAEDRHIFMEKYLEEFHKEWEGNI